MHIEMNLHSLVHNQGVLAGRLTHLNESLAHLGYLKDIANLDNSLGNLSYLADILGKLDDIRFGLRKVVEAIEEQ